jgi:Fe-S cluster assembly ATP-binding protein
MSNILKIEGLKANVEEKEILNGLDLTVKSGEIHAIMGPNGSGKSTFCKVLMGHPKYQMTAGSIKLNDESLEELATNERANKGLFLGFQHPQEVPGVTLSNFLRLAKNAQLKANGEETLSPRDFLNQIKEHSEKVKIDRKFINRPVNEGFSGGEKKRAEILQMSFLKPKFALLDEIDSGLDIDALKQVAEAINSSFKDISCGVILITHYKRLLKYVKPDFVHIMHNGKIIKSGDLSLADTLEEEGYDAFTN